MKIEVNVTANSSRESIINVGNGKYKVFLMKPAVKNKANIELTKVLKKYFKRDVRILKGQFFKRKLIEVIDGN